jgi:hypothetical protein
VRLCPLVRVEIPCDPAAPLCSWCGENGAIALAAIAKANPAPEGKSQRACTDCRTLYAPTSPRQQRCPACRVAHDKRLNAQYQQSFRTRKAARS